jgi:hypothetical protein
MAKNQANIPEGVTEEDIQTALALLAKKQERDKVRAQKIASGEIVPKKYKAKAWSELTEEQRQKRKDYSKKWAAEQRRLAAVAKKYLLENPDKA